MFFSAVGLIPSESVKTLKVDQDVKKAMWKFRHHLNNMYQISHVVGYKQPQVHVRRVKIK